MNSEDRLEARTLLRGIAAVGVALAVAALGLAGSMLWDGRNLASTTGEVLGTRTVDDDAGPRPELLVAYRTAAGDTMVFAEAIGILAPDVGAQVTVWYSDGAEPRALIARQRFVWPALLLPTGLVLAAFALWRLRQSRRAAETGWEAELEELSIGADGPEDDG